MNIFPPTPITYPSDLYSIAGETIELEKPVIGIKEPAPANLPILLKQFNINTLDYKVINSTEISDINKIKEELIFPVIIKPAHLGSSIGINIANDIETFENGLKMSLKYDNKIIKKYIIDYILNYLIDTFYHLLLYK